MKPDRFVLVQLAVAKRRYKFIILFIRNVLNSAQLPISKAISYINQIQKHTFPLLWRCVYSDSERVERNKRKTAKIRMKYANFKCKNIIIMETLENIKDCFLFSCVNACQRNVSNKCNSSTQNQFVIIACIFVCKRTAFQQKVFPIRAMREW